MNSINLLKLLEIQEKTTIPYEVLIKKINQINLLVDNMEELYVIRQDLKCNNEVGRCCTATCSFYHSVGGYKERWSCYVRYLWNDLYSGIDPSERKEIIVKDMVYIRDTLNNIKDDYDLR